MVRPLPEPRMGRLGEMQPQPPKRSLLRLLILMSSIADCLSGRGNLIASTLGKRPLSTRPFKSAQRVVIAASERAEVRFAANGYGLLVTYGRVGMGSCARICIRRRPGMIVSSAVFKDAFMRSNAAGACST